MELLANTSNNTVYADDQGNIAYWHGNFMPKRDPSLNWSKPVDGSTSITEWKGLHPLNELIQIKIRRMDGFRIAIAHHLLPVDIRAHTRQIFQDIWLPMEIISEVCMLWNY